MPATAICLICDQLGQVIFHTRLSAAIAARTPENRQNKKVAGSTYGIAKRAITKPVLQMSTNIGAIALSKESFMDNCLKILRIFTESLILGSFLISPSQIHQGEVMLQRNIYAIYWRKESTLDKSLKSENKNS